MLGPKYAVITGVGGSLVSGMTFDIYSLYFAPVQITTGYLAGLMYKKGMLKGVKNNFSIFFSFIISFILAKVSFGSSKQLPEFITSNIVLNNFDHATINVFANNTSSVKRDGELVNWFANKYKHLVDNPNIEVI